MRFRYYVGYLLVLLVLGGSICGCVALGKNEAIRSQNPSDQSFNFVQITDTHFGEHDHFRRMRGIVKEINQLPMTIAFVVHTGDIVADRIKNRAVVAETRAVLNELDAPVYFVAGNHDILADDIEATADAYRENFGKLVQQISVQGVTFIFIYTEPLARSVKIPGYDPLYRLQALLQQSRNSPVVVFHHRPSAGDFT